MSTLKKLIYNLNTISNIPRGRRVRTTGDLISIDDDTPLQGLWRWISSEGRDRTVKFICNEIRYAILLSKYMMAAISTTTNAAEKDELCSDLKALMESLNRTPAGIENICWTYKNDTQVEWNMDNLKNEISDCLTSIRECLAAVSLNTLPAEEK